MTTRRSLALKSPLARMAVAGAATLATVVATAPMAVATDEEAAGTESSQSSEPEKESSKADEPKAEESQPEPKPESKPEPPAAEPTPGPEKNDEGSEEQKDDAEPAETSKAAAAVEDDSELQIVEDGEDGETKAENDSKDANGNDLTVAADDADGIDIDVLANDENVDYATDYVAVSQSPSAGTAAADPITRQTINYTPDGSTTGPVTFEYEIRRQAPALAAGRAAAAIEEPYTVIDSAQVTVEVTPAAVAASPDAVDDPGEGPTIQVVAGSSVTIDVLANDTFESGDVVAPGTGIGQQPSKGSVAPSGNSNQAITYTALPGSSGSDTFSYTLTRPAVGDSDPLTDTAQVTVNIVEAEGPIEPDFGFQKFRAGVQSTDGSFSTVGSTLRVVIRDEDGMTVYDEPCTTTAESETNDTSYCDGVGLIGGPLAGRVRGAAAVDEPSGIPQDQSFPLPPGYSAKVTQLTAADGLKRDRKAVNIGPCEADFLFFCTGSDVLGNGFIKATTALFKNSPPDSGVKDSTASVDDDAVLPDTGAPGGLGLLGLGGLLVAGGAGLAARGRRTERESGDLA